MDAHLPQCAGVGRVSSYHSGVAPLTSLDRRNHIFAVIAGTVLALGLVRAALLVAYTPTLGYLRPHVFAGVLGIVLVGAVAILTALALRRHPVASIVHAMLFFLIVADPVTTLWLTSVAPERYGAIAAYAVTAMVAVVALGNARPVHWAVLGLGLLMLSRAPGHFFLLPLVLALVISPLLLRRSRKGSLFMFGAAIAATVIALIFHEVPVAPHPANGDSLVPAVALDRSGGSLLHRALRAMARAMPSATALAPAGLEVSSQGSVRRLADLPPSIMSFAALAARMPATVSMMIAMIAFVTAPFAVLWLAWAARRNEPVMTAIPAVFAVLVTIAAYCSLASVLMPETPDVARSQWLGATSLLAAVVLVLLVAWHLAADIWAGRVAVAVVFGVVLMAVGWFAWARTEPLAIGTIESVKPGAGRTLALSGWAIDPRGIKRVYATVGDGPVTEATLGTERRDVQAAYPGYPDALTGGFQMSIAPNAWRENQRLRIFAENRTGAVTEIDQRDVRLAP